MYVHLVPFILTVLVLGGWLFWLTWNRADLADRCDQAADEADKALRAVEHVTNHLTETEPPSAGRHAHARQL